MSDPQRWSEGGDASELERALLAAGQSSRLPEGERRALWASIALSLPATPAPTPEATAGVGLGKLAAWAGLVASVGLGAWGWVTSSATSPAAPVAVAAPSVATVPALPSVAPSAGLEVETPPTAPAPEPKPRASSASRLREESAAVLEARAALRAGDAPRSLRLLEQARARFGRGALGQEREALTIEALFKAGRRPEARRRAEAFLSRHPQSPYATDLRRIAEN